MWVLNVTGDNNVKEAGFSLTLYVSTLVKHNVFNVTDVYMICVPLLHGRCQYHRCQCDR